MHNCQAEKYAMCGRSPACTLEGLEEALMKAHPILLDIHHLNYLKTIRGNYFSEREVGFKDVSL